MVKGNPLEVVVRVVMEVGNCAKGLSHAATNQKDTVSRVLMYHTHVANVDACLAAFDNAPFIEGLQGKGTSLPPKDGGGSLVMYGTILRAQRTGCAKLEWYRDVVVDLCHLDQESSNGCVRSLDGGELLPRLVPAF